MSSWTKTKCGACSADEVPERPLDAAKGCLLAFTLLLLLVLAAIGVCCGYGVLG